MENIVFLIKYFVREKIPVIVRRTFLYLIYSDFLVIVAYTGKSHNFDGTHHGRRVAYSGISRNRVLFDGTPQERRVWRGVH